MFTAAATPRDIAKRMHGDAASAFSTPDVRQTLSAEGAELVADTPEAFTAYFKAEIAEWAKVVAFGG